MIEHRKQLAAVPNVDYRPGPLPDRGVVRLRTIKARGLSEALRLVLIGTSKIDIEGMAACP
jgi:hypothetical protein